jgi:hypothetical protein
VRKKNEIFHWEEPVSLIEEKVVSRRIEGSSAGLSVRVARGVSYRVGASRGRIVAETAHIATATGALLFSNQRVVFSGSSKSFAYKHDRIIDFSLFDDGCMFGIEGKQNRMMFQFMEKRTRKLSEYCGQESSTHMQNSFEIHPQTAAAIGPQHEIFDVCHLCCSFDVATSSAVMPIT